MLITPLIVFFNQALIASWEYALRIDLIVEGKMLLGVP